MSAQPTIDELLDQAVRALNRGDRPTADALAGQVLQVDRGNADAEELLAALTDSGEIRRMTISDVRDQAKLVITVNTLHIAIATTTNTP